MKSLISHLALWGLSFAMEFSAVARPATIPEPFTMTLDAWRSTAYDSATAHVDYGRRTLQLVLQPRMPACPEGRVCIQAFPPAQTVLFRNVKISSDDCGVIEARALTEKTQLTFINRSQSTCEENPEVVAELVLKSRWSEAKRDTFALARDLTAKLSHVASQQFESGTVTFNRVRGEVELTLLPFPADCTADRTCGEELPDPVVISLTNAHTEINSCGIVSTKALLENRSMDGSLQQVTIHDNRYNKCPTYLPLATLDVIYETLRYSRADQELIILGSDMFSAAEID